MWGRRGVWIFENVMTTDQMHWTAADLWAVLNKEITGIQVLWETVERVYLAPDRQALLALEEDTPLVYRLLQTALMESVLIRLARMMDSARSGKGEDQKNNLSLKRLVALEPGVENDEMVVRALWDESNLKAVRDKYLSHNDLTRLMAEPHTLSIPLEMADIEAMRAMTTGMRELRRNVQRKLNPGVAYPDQGVSLDIQREVETLNRSLLAGQLFFGLLPDHDVLQQAWQVADHG